MEFYLKRRKFYLKKIKLYSKRKKFHSKKKKECLKRKKFFSEGKGISADSESFYIPSNQLFLVAAALPTLPSQVHIRKPVKYRRLANVSAVTSQQSKTETIGILCLRIK